MKNYFEILMPSYKEFEFYTLLKKKKNATPGLVKIWFYFQKSSEYISVIWLKP